MLSGLANTGNRTSVTLYRFSVDLFVYCPLRSLLKGHGTYNYMAVTFTPDTETFPTKTQPQRRAGGWSIEPEPRIGLGLGSDDELLLVENRTVMSWLIYHEFHRLGIIEPDELLIFHLYKHGSLSVRPWNAGDEVEYLVLPLNFDITFVYIYRRQMGKDIEIFDMRPL